DYASAEKYYNDGLEIARRENSYYLAAHCLLSLASLHDQQKHGSQAQSEANEALAFFKPNGYAYETALGSILVGRFQRNQGKYAEALDSFQQAYAMADKAKDAGTRNTANSSLGSLLEVQERYPEALTVYLRETGDAAGAESVGYSDVQTGGMLWRLGRYD